MNDVATFLETCSASPSALTPLKVVWRTFNNALPPGRKGAYSRDRFIGELIRAGFAIGELENVAHVCGLALPGVAWRAIDGQIKLAGVA
jgi:hypothetical protein